MSRLRSWLPVAVAAFMLLLGCAFSGCSIWLDRSGREAQSNQLRARGDIHLRRQGNAEAYVPLDAAVRNWDRRQRFDLGQRLEWMTFDWRMRKLAGIADPAPELGLVFADDTTIVDMAEGTVLTEERWDLLWPRWPVYGRALRELRDQGASVVAFDILFPDRRLSEDQLNVIQPGDEPDTLFIEQIASDPAFASELGSEGAPAILATLPGSIPHSLFRTNVALVGDVASPQDADGVTRRVRAYSRYRWTRWEFLADAAELGMRIRILDGNRVRISTVGVPGFSIAAIGEDGWVTVKNDDPPLRMQIYEESIVWHLGIAMAAAHMGLDLERAEIHPDHVVLRNEQGLERRIPVDANGYMQVAWQLNFNQNHLITQQNLSDVLRSSDRRRLKLDPSPDTLWNNRMALIGSFASGNNLADRGATPLEKSGFLVTTYLNVANMLIKDRFIKVLPASTELLGILVLGMLSSLATWRLATALAPFVLILFGVAWVLLAHQLFLSQLIWLPVAYPILGGIALPYLGLTSYRVIFEQSEQHRVRSIFAKMVSPDIVQEMLKGSEVGVQLGGARREVTVFFADVRGFTELTDRQQDVTEKFVSSRKLTGADAEAVFEQNAHMVLETVNQYLAAIADVIKDHEGTLDKYIGDCVMAFWGAPTDNPKHAVQCVSAAIQAQMAIRRLNESRTKENQRRELAAAQNPEVDPLEVAPLPILELGTGINTGVVTVGLMGSDDHIVNYTVFGRDVNLASRLEGVSGRSRIVMGEQTYLHVRRFFPALAGMCRELPTVEVKGFKELVVNYEVDWISAAELLDKQREKEQERVRAKEKGRGR